MENSILKDVSDTALWVAVYRDRETARSDALFQDPMAARLAGDRGKNIEKMMSSSRYVAWSVVVRTCMIDSYIKELITEGIDTVVNLGAGLDTRPYRMQLPSDLQWIEVDFAHMIAYKERHLADEKANCQLRRIGLDLSKEDDRQKLLSELNARGRKILVLTEGVTPYLSNADVQSLAKALRQQTSFSFWITDYNSPALFKYLSRPKRVKEMKNAPFLFNPADWFSFFADCGWRVREIRYIGEEGEKLGRPPPYPLWVKIMQSVFLSPAKRANYRRMHGYAILEPKN
jgi:methyltransferase (TIGR00027 family)